MEAMVDHQMYPDNKFHAEGISLYNCLENLFLLCCVGGLWRLFEGPLRSDPGWNVLFAVYISLV